MMGGYNRLHFRDDAPCSVAYSRPLASNHSWRLTVVRFHWNCFKQHNTSQHISPKLLFNAIDASSESLKG